jgi:hypothetical protein
MTYNSNILHPAWVTGFIDGEGTFFIDILKNSTMSLGFQVQLQFVITQHIRDAELVHKFVDFFGCGYVAKDGPTKLQYRIRGYNDFGKSLFPLLNAHPLVSQKRLDAEAFRRVYTMMGDKRHLTTDGLAEIRAIKATMNRARMTQYKALSK